MFLSRTVVVLLNAMRAQREPGDGWRWRSAFAGPSRIAAEDNAGCGEPRPARRSLRTRISLSGGWCASCGVFLRLAMP
jgi:hypothetical protein